jgi:beta-lactamase class A
LRSRRQWLYAVLIVGLALASGAAYAGISALFDGRPDKVQEVAAEQAATLSSSPRASSAPTASALAAPAVRLLEADLTAMTAGSGARLGVSLQELNGTSKASFSLGGDQSFNAASAYKLPLLMAEAQQIAAGQASPNDRLCYKASDQEDGWFDDYNPGNCFSRQELARRTGIYSDNTAAHILVRYLGGPQALNAYATGAGMASSALWNPNTTTPDDLATALANEVTGRLGGSAAQQWLYPLLMHPVNEQGIASGVPSTASVAHKMGSFSRSENDSAYVTSGPIRYVLSVAIDGTDEATGWSIIAQVSARIWQYESSRLIFDRG